MGLRAQDVYSGLQTVDQTSGIIAAELDATRLAGMAATVAANIKGIDLAATTDEPRAHDRKAPDPAGHHPLFPIASARTDRRAPVTASRQGGSGSLPQVSGRATPPGARAPAWPVRAPLCAPRVAPSGTSRAAAR